MIAKEDRVRTTVFLIELPAAIASALRKIARNAGTSPRWVATRGLTSWVEHELAAAADDQAAAAAAEDARRARQEWARQEAEDCERAAAATRAKRARAYFAERDAMRRAEAAAAGAAAAGAAAAEAEKERRRCRRALARVDR
jgi:hypothetical protein